MKFATKLLLGLALTLALINNASAATLNISNSILMGASGVSVNGELYDVVFKDGVVENSITAFTTESSATAASQALLNQVLVGTYDSKPQLTNGCPALSDCYLVTAYATFQFGGSDYKYLSYALNSYGNNANKALTGNAQNNWDSSNSTNFTLALWTKQPTTSTATAVPEPEAYAMMLAGLGLVGFAARRKQQAA